MINSLKFVQGAIASKDFVPELMHFRIENNTIRSYNGILGLCSPIALDLQASPKAVPFIKAIQTCKEPVQLHMTPAGRLSIKSGKFKAFIECSTETLPDDNIQGEEIPILPGFKDALKLLAPFIAEDASRPWARGILFRGESAFATNNICLVEYWLGLLFPVEINIPKHAVTEMIRINEDPEKMIINADRATFFYSGNRWLSTQTYSTKWPDLSRVLNQSSNQLPLPSGLFEGLHDLIPFVDEFGRIFFTNGVISTTQHEGIGASVNLSEIIVKSGCYNYKQLLLLEKNIKTVDFSTYPNPCLFQGDRLRGAIVGMRF